MPSARASPADGVRVLCVGSIYPPHDFGGGYEATWRDTVAHLRDRGHEVRVLASDHRSPGLGPEASEDLDTHRELRSYWREHRFPRLGPRERVAHERHNAAVLARHLDEFRPDVVCWWPLGGISLGLFEQVRRAGVAAVGVVGDDWLAWGADVDAPQELPDAERESVTR